MTSSWLALPLIVVCACAAPRSVAPSVPVTNPAALFASVRGREESIGSLRARFTAESRRGEERHSTTGVLLVKKPDRFRLRMMLPFGLTVFDYVRCGDRTQLSLPLQDRVETGSAADNLIGFSSEDLGQVFLRGPDAFPGVCAPDHSDGAALVVLCRDASGAVLRQIRIDPAQATIAEETSYAAGESRLILRYEDVRPAGDTALPYRITLQYPVRGVSLEIAIQRYEVNPVLADDLFQPAIR